MAGFYSDSPVQDQIDADELSATEAKTAAEAAQAAAEAAQAAAETAKAGAEASELAAGSSETNAAQSATSAANSATSAATQAASASSSASSAASSDSSAAASASNAAASATAAATSASTASGHETTASTKASEASASAANAAASETAAAASELAAASSESAAASSATAAASSATTAATEAGNAATSATAAAASETNPASSATAAAASETAAAASETAAAASESAAAASETAAGTSETNAAGSASAAASSATAAASSATAAASSESAAAGSATAAASSATDAATSASNAATSESNAATSETNAATSASNAATSETNAATSATNASTSETNAAGSATSAASSASAAGSARDAALAALDSFDDRYLGQKTSDPSLDNDGNALISGALYFDSTNSLMKVYDGSQWLAAYASTSGSLLAANNLSDLADAATARTNLGLGTAATTASTAYATAAQGALADSATQPGDNVSTLANDAGYLTSFTETDPVFSASAAAGISATNITNWNTAYGWGDHASAGYLTGNQTITLSGDASGSGTTSIVVTVADDSHNHVISNVDGLQTALDGKLSTSGKAADSNLLDGLDSTAFLRSNASDTMDAGTSTTLTILSDDTGASTIQLYGASQGTGRVYVGQDVSYGGGIEYNGDNSPSTTGAGADYVTLWRRDNGTDSWTARNYYNSNNWEFRGNLYANTNQRVFADDYHPNADKWTTARTLSLTGAVTGSASIDGSGNVSLATTATSDPTLTLSGDASGSATFTNLGNATLSVTVSDDSHNHTLLKTKGTYVNSASTQGRSYDYGAQLEFVRSNEGWPNYGTVVTFKGYSASEDGSVFQFYSPYSATYGGYHLRYRLGLYSNAGWTSWYDILSDNGTAQTKSGSLRSSTDMRAPIFYDQNNTGYYTDPAGTSVLSVLRLDSTQPYQLYSNNTWLNIRYNAGGGGGISLYDNGNVLQGTWYGNGAGEHGFLDNDGSWAVRVRTSTNPLTFYCNNNAELYVYTSYVLAAGSSRAPVFYDSANTGYYFDGSSTGDSIRVAGNIVAYYSDERLKTNLGNIESPVDKVKQLNGFRYQANETAAKHGYDMEPVHVGVSAQEVEAVLPEVVCDAPIGHGYKTVQYERLVPLLIEAIKEQAGQIEALQAEVAKLKG